MNTQNNYTGFTRPLHGLAITKESLEGFVIKRATA